jgi:predicted metal-dependent phosphoesterase TrpH
VGVSGLAQPFRVVQDTLTPSAAITLPAAAGLQFQVVPGLSARTGWGGQDTLCGVRSYDVQYRDALTPTWTAWLSGTAEIQAPFVGQREHSYYSRVRATD